MNITSHQIDTPAISRAAHIRLWASSRLQAKGADDDDDDDNGKLVMVLGQY